MIRKKKTRKNSEEKQIYLTTGQIKNQLLSYLSTEIKRYSGHDPFMIYMLKLIKNEIETLNNTNDISGIIFGLQINIDNLVEKAKQLIPPDAINDEIY